jgi:hypothetical protein
MEVTACICCLGVGDLTFLALLAARSRRVGVAWFAVGFAAVKGAALTVLWFGSTPPPNSDEGLGQFLFGWLLKCWAVGAVATVASLLWALAGRKRHPPDSPS